MTLEMLMLLAAVLLAFLAAGVAYLFLRRVKRKHKTSEEKLQQLTRELLEKIETHSLTEEQKAKIVDAIRSAKR